MRTITVTNSYLEPTLDLLATADAVAVIAATDQRHEHWNSAENTEWESASNARMALHAIGQRAPHQVQLVRPGRHIGHWE